MAISFTSVAVIVVSRILFSRVLPRLDGAEGSLPGRRRLVSFVAGEYLLAVNGREALVIGETDNVRGGEIWRIHGLDNKAAGWR